MTKQPAFNGLAALHEVRNKFEGELQSLRDRIADTQARIAELDTAPLPLAECVNNLNDWLDRQAAEFADRASYEVSGLCFPEGSGECRALRAPVRAGTAETVAESDLGPMVAFLLGPELKTRLAILLEARGLAHGEPLADRPAARQKLSAELDRLELAEERLVCEGEGAGIVVHRRPDARPEIILSLEL